MSAYAIYIWLLIVSIGYLSSLQASQSESMEQIQADIKVPEFLEFHYKDASDHDDELDLLDQKFSILVKQLTGLMNNIDKDVFVQSIKIGSLSKENKKMQSRINELEERILLQGISMPELRHWQLDEREPSCYCGADAIAFSAYNDVNSTHNTRDDDSIIKFPGVEINHGNGYDGTTSIFTCPRRGAYFFTVTLHNQGGTMKKNGIKIAHVLNNDNNSSMAFQMSNSVIVKCDRKSQVWIQSQGTPTKTDSTEKIRLSTFSGFLLTD